MSSILVYTEAGKEGVKKSSLEAVNYAQRLASKLGSSVTALICNASDTQLKELAQCGANKVLHAKGDILNQADPYSICKLLELAVHSEASKNIIFSFDTIGKNVAPRLAARLKAGLVAGVIEDVVVKENSFEVRKNVFSGKASAIYSINSEIKVISVLPNSFQVAKGEGSAEVVDFSYDAGLITSRVKVKEVRNTNSGGMVPLPEAELVVSAGRGMKAPENWGMIEELANVLGATTACSRPVSDMHWRPHHEHVGQTGIAIRPNLYIAIGISGAIQHLAGVNGSKTIVVINNDKEAPFFKAADYGVVGDAFEVVPKLIDALKRLKASSN
jgi:electron transfer flavoprotein alpha subunit